MRRLNEYITGISERKQPPGAQSGDKIGTHVDIGARYETQRNCLRVKARLKLDGRLANRRTGIVVKPRQNMRRAGYNLYALRDGGLGHRQ